MRIVYHDSKVSTYQRCPRRCYWEYIRRLRPKVTGIPLADGRALHAGLEVLYDPKGRELGEAIEALSAAYIEDAGPKDNFMPSQWEELTRQIEWGSRVLHAYQSQVMPSDTWKVLQTESASCVQLGEVCYRCSLEYATSIGGKESHESCRGCGADVYWWAGRTDLIVKDGRVVRIVDHKCPKSAGADYMNKYAYSFQLLGYVYNTRKANPALPVTGFIVNVVKRLKTTGSEKARGNPFMRKAFPVSEDDLDRFVVNRISVINCIERDIARFSTDPVEAFPMDTFTCGWSCPWVNVCWNTDPMKWWEPNEVWLTDFEERPDNYVDEFSKEA